MDNLTCRRETDFRLGVVARAICEQQDLFTVLADPLAFIGRGMRIPSGPATLIPGVPEHFRSIDEAIELERWDGLS